MKSGRSAALKSKLHSAIDIGKRYWNTPAEGNYVPYKEVAMIGAAGFGVHWASLLASTIGLDAGNFLVGASIGLRPLDLQIMLMVANVIGIPLGFFRGWYFDNHHMKGGKFIPFMIRTPFPLIAISTVFVWLPYEHWSYVTKAVVVWFFYMVLQIFLCFYNEGWAYFQQIITPNAQERANVMSISQIIYSLAPSITNLVIPTVAGWTFGLNNIQTYRIIYPGFTVVGLVVILIFFPKLKERIILPKKGLEYVSIADSVREVAKNKYFWIITSASWVGFLENAYGAVLSWSFVYAYGGAKQALLGVVNTINGNGALWALIAVPFLIKLLGKRNLLILSNLTNIVLLTILYFTYHNLFMVCVVFYLNNFVNCLGNVYMPNLQADMRDYHQWKTGVRVDGLFGPMGFISTVLGFFTGLIIPSLQEKLGLHEDYNVLYDDTLRNNLFGMLITCAVIGAVLNVIPYLFYDLTESKHRGYVNVLKIRSMFEDFGDGVLDDAQLIEAVDLIRDAQKYAGSQKQKIDKTPLKAARKLPKETEAQKESRKAAIAAAKRTIRELRQQNEIIESLPIVLEELQKFGTTRYRTQLAAAKETVAQGKVAEYADWKARMAQAKALPHGTKEEREIRADAIALARTEKTAAKLLQKVGRDHLTEPNREVQEALQNRETHSLRENVLARRELKAYVRGVSVYRRIVAPYENAHNLIVQAENYTHLAEIEAMYQEAKDRVAVR